VAVFPLYTSTGLYSPSNSSPVLVKKTKKKKFV